MIHSLSFDIEEHFQVAAFDCPARRRHWDVLHSRVEQSTETILSLLEEVNVQATMFILGWVAERHGGLVKRLANAGHEIACHGYSHELISVQSPSKFREDIRTAKKILEDLTGKAVLGVSCSDIFDYQRNKMGLADPGRRRLSLRFEYRSRCS